MNDRSERHELPLRASIEQDKDVVLLDPDAEHAVAAVRGQLLVGEHELEVSEFAAELRGLAELVADRHPDHPGSSAQRVGYEHESVGLWRLNHDDDLTETVGRLRRVSARGDAARVSPNHILVPCPHWCPATPPEPTSEAVAIPAFDDDTTVSVVVIDAGWVDVPLLTARGGIEVVRPASWRTALGGAWSSATDGIVPGGSGSLPAISGHATFIVGEIAARCPNARILVVNHPDPWADEWSVAASLAQWAGAHCEGVVDVVSCGFAVATLDERPSFPFAHALGQLAPTTAVVSPAGNQGSFVPHWPAAFKRVVGVGAFDEHQGNMIAGFSNRGVWVDCSAGGCDAVSTFVPGDWVPQDASGPPPGPFAEFARWSGTSFATPRFTAEVARRLAHARAARGANNGRRVAHKLVAGLVPELVLGSDAELGTKLDLP